jgi:hypothetical protein
MTKTEQIIVKISDDAFPRWPLIRQTPHSSGQWDNCRFVINEGLKECDFWVVYGSIKKIETTLCPPENTILITTEPPSVQQYHPRFLKQFATVITCHPNLVHPNVVHTQQGLPWHIGKVQKTPKELEFSRRYEYDELQKFKSFAKTKEISVIASNMQITAGHRQRLQFVKQLSSYFGEKLDVFGRGIREVGDKWDAIAAYKYHVVIENSSFPDYWTEKLADTYLAGAYPIYYGCPNLDQYFSKAAFTYIDIHDVEKSIAVIEQCIKEDRYEKVKPEIMKARDLILDQYNLFPLIAGNINLDHSYLEKHYSKQRIKLYPEPYWQGAKKRFKYWAREMFGGKF